MPAAIIEKLTKHPLYQACPEKIQTWLYALVEELAPNWDDEWEQTPNESVNRLLFEVLELPDYQMKVEDEMIFDEVSAEVMSHLFLDANLAAHVLLGLGLQPGQVSGQLNFDVRAGIVLADRQAGILAGYVKAIAPKEQVVPLALQKAVQEYRT